MFWKVWWLATLMQMFAPKIIVEPAHDWERLFMPSEGWIGSDCAYSVPLNQNTLLWLYDDTFIGSIKDGKRTNAIMVRNSIGIQKGRFPDRAEVRFIWGKDNFGKPKDFIKPPDGKGWFWFGHGSVCDDKLWLFLWQFEPSEAEPPFNFALKASWLAKVENFHDEPEKWKFEFVPVPFFLQSHERTICFGNAILSEGYWVFVYGVSEDKRHQPLKRSLIIARIPKGEVDDFGSWRFYRQGNWISDWRNAETFGDDLGFEFTVSFVPSLKLYVAVYSPADLSPVVKIRWSQTPFGKWSEPIVAYQCPQRMWSSSVFCYAAKAHPFLSGAKDLLITYASNSFDFRLLLEDSRLYFPHFVRLKF
ncbi:MAG: hypothetical protein NZ805_01950 [Armatimonadetes bacterium]|nr:hypothetical protein [Armatimonadota bacterium]MDW8027109.1 hypothetical protein [Armatimonadota bacterium]